MKDFSSIEQFKRLMPRDSSERTPVELATILMFMLTVVPVLTFVAKSPHLLSLLRVSQVGQD